MQGSRLANCDAKLFIFVLFSSFAEYENENQEGENFDDCTKGQEDRDKDKVCSFQIGDLGKECTWQKDYGYDEGQPCVLLKLNKVWVRGQRAAIETSLCFKL